MLSGHSYSIIMKKIVLTGLILGLGLSSCNRDDSSTETGISQADRVVSYEASELVGGLLEMNESFAITGKASSLSYSYKAYAEPPQVNGIRTNATSVFDIRDVVFVTWHTLNSPYGGAITAYKLNPSTGKYVFTDRIDFVDTDFHEATGSINTGNGTYEIFAAGQRDPDASGYLLSNHNGAVVTSIHYDYINDAFDASTIKELPLPSYGANGIVAAAGSYYVITGNGNGNSGLSSAPGGIYKTDYALTNVAAAFSLNDGITVGRNPIGSSPTGASIAYVDRKSDTQFDIYTGDYIDNSPGGDLGTVGGNPTTTVNATGDVERSGLAFETTSSFGSLPLFALGEAGLYDQGGNLIADYGTCLSVAYDDGAKVVYYAGGDGGLYVLAGYDYRGGALIGTHDLIGNFTPPTGGSFPGQYDIKDVSVYGSENIALATGLGGVYFIKRN